jgi:DedD protein
MRGVFDDREQEPVEARGDAELTLGSGALLAIGLGLLLLCGLFFGLGYAIGHRGSAVSPAATTPPEQQAATGAQPLASASLAKPSATPQAAQAATLQPVDASQPPADVSAPASAAAPAPPELPQSSTEPGAPQIRPALTPAVESNAPAQPGAAPANTVRPAFAPAAQPVATPAGAGSLMVQIAAVSSVEDAQVLANALRKRGYAVSARREPADNLIHVRIGPFATPAEANSWKMRLLNDGYNAIVQQ